MPALKMAHGVKIKYQPLETKIALRLITLSEQRKTTAELRPLAKEVGCTFMEALKAVELLAVKKVITFKAITANEFSFQVEPEHLAGLRKDAHAFNRHLEANATRRLNPHRADNPPAHLKPFTEQERGPFMEKATAISTKLGVPKLAFKVANCIARLGEEEVNKMVEATLLAYKSTPKPPMSAVCIFFTLYRARRDTLIPATN